MGRGDRAAAGGRTGTVAINTHAGHADRSRSRHSRPRPYGVCPRDDPRGRRSWRIERARRPVVPPIGRASSAGVPGARDAGRRGRSRRHPVRRFCFGLSDRQRRTCRDPAARWPADSSVDVAHCRLAGTCAGCHRCRCHRGLCRRRRLCTDRCAVPDVHAGRCGGGTDRCSRGRRALGTRSRRSA